MSWKQIAALAIAAVVACIAALAKIEESSRNALIGFASFVAGGTFSRMLPDKAAEAVTRAVATRGPSLVAGALLVSLVACPGCPNPTTTQQKWIDCSAAAVRTHGIPAIPAVNECLTQSMGWEACLIGLIQPAAGITKDVLACVLLQRAENFGAMAAQNPEDEVSRTAAERARAFIEKQDYKFSPEEVSMVPGLTPPGQLIPKHLAVYNHSSLADDRDVAFWTEAVNIQMREHVSPHWDREAPGVAFYGSVEHMDPDKAALLGIVNDDGNAESAGYHTQLGPVIYGLVDVHQSRHPSGTLSHEAGEILCDATLDRKVPGPHGWLYYVEPWDPTQGRDYMIEVTLFGERRKVLVSDFVLPAWYGLRNTAGGSHRTFLGARNVAPDLDPFAPAPGGYQIAEQDGRVMFLSEGPFAMNASRMSRTRRIMDRHRNTI